MWSTYEHRPRAGGGTVQTEAYARNLAHKRCGLRETSGTVQLDYGPIVRLPGVLATVAKLVQSMQIKVVLEDDIVVANARSASRVIAALRLFRVTAGGLSDEDSVRNLVAAVSIGVPGHTPPLTGVLANLTSRAGCAWTMDPRTFRHEIDRSVAVTALRDACWRLQDALPQSARYGTQSVVEESDVVVDNNGSVWPTTLTNSLSDTRFGLVTGRRKATYATSWTYVPIVLDNEHHVALRCMDLSELERGFMWVTRQNRRALHSARRVDPEWLLGWADVDDPVPLDEESDAMDFGWVPLHPERDSVVRLIRSEGASQCQQTWTQLGTMAHARLRVYDIIPNSVTEESDLQPRVDNGASTSVVECRGA